MLTAQFINDFNTKGVTINCCNEDEINEFLQLLESLGYIYLGTELPVHRNRLLDHIHNITYSGWYGNTVQISGVDKNTIRFPDLKCNNMYFK